MIELPPMRYVKESSTSGNLLMEALVIDVTPDYFVSFDEGDELRTDVDVEDMSMVDAGSMSSPPITEAFDESQVPRPPRRRHSDNVTMRQPICQDTESFHSAKDPGSSAQKEGEDLEMESEHFIDALSYGRSKSESLAITESRKRNVNESSEEHEVTKKKRKGDKPLESKVSFDEDSLTERPSSRNNKDRLLQMIEQLSEPVIQVRKALVTSDFVFQDETLLRSFMTENFTTPIEKLCELISDVESKALRNAGDRSLAQAVRILILETIGGPTEELLRGLELIKREEQNAEMDISILESLVDPVDEVLFGISKICHEMSGKCSSKFPVVLERTIFTTQKLGETLKEVTDDAPIEVTPALRIIHSTLDNYLHNITLNQVRTIIFKTLPTVSKVYSIYLLINIRQISNVLNMI